MKISIIAAMDEKRGIGGNNDLLFRIPEDMRRFSDITSGHVVVMGRKTFESIGRPLPNRTNIVITHSASLARSLLAKLIVVHSLREAFDRAKELGENEVFVIGGGQIYEQALPFVDKLYLTIVEGDFGADTFFPKYEYLFKRVVFEKEGESQGYKYKFLELER